MAARPILAALRALARPAAVGIALPVLTVLLVLVRLLMIPLRVLVIAGFGGSIFMGWQGHYMNSVVLAVVTVLLAIPVGLYHIGADRLGLHDVAVRVRR